MSFKPDFGQPKREKPEQKRTRFNAPQADKTAVRRVTNQPQPKATKDAPGKKPINYKRKTIELYVNQIEYIRTLADNERMGLAELYRWLIDEGLHNYDAGHIQRPRRRGRGGGNTTEPEKKLKAVTLTFEQIERMPEVARNKRMKLMACYRWIIDQGLQNYEAGQRPFDQELDDDVRLGHWTSTDREF